MNIRCAIFDFDGTLFDSMFIWDSIAEVYLLSLGKEAAPSTRELVRAMSLHQAACYLRDEYELPLSVDEIMADINRIVEHYYTDEILPKPGAADFLGELKRAGVSLCIATASERCQVEAALKRCGLEQFFDAVFTCGELGRGKDEPLIFRKAMGHFGAERSNTVIFEDAIHAVRTAKADGFAVAAVFDDSEKRQDELRQLCDCYLMSFEHSDAFWKFASAE